MNEIFLKEMQNAISRIIREELQKYVITEMAIPLKDYKNKVESLMQQILENWCLVRYSTISGDKTEWKKHWSMELAAHINNVASMKVKNGDKQKALYSLWNMYDWDTDESCIAQRLWTKFYKENIPTEGEYFAQVVSDFKNETKKLIKILASGYPTEVKEYINNI